MKEIGADIIATNVPVINTTIHKDLLGTLITGVIISILNYETEIDYEQRRTDQRQGIDLLKKQELLKPGRNYGRPKIELPENWNNIIKLID